MEQDETIATHQPLLRDALGTQNAKLYPRSQLFSQEISDLIVCSAEKGIKYSYCRGLACQQSFSGRNKSSSLSRRISVKQPAQTHRSKKLFPPIEFRLRISVCDCGAWFISCVNCCDITSRNATPHSVARDSCAAHTVESYSLLGRNEFVWREQSLKMKRFIWIPMILTVLWVVGVGLSNHFTSLEARFPIRLPSTFF